MRVGIWLLLASATAYARPVTVFLDRDGGKVDGVQLPPYGGGKAAWRGIVACVRRQYEPFNVEIVEARPAARPYITAMVGGLASQLGYDNEKVGGISPYRGYGVVDAVVHVFSQTSDSAPDVDGLCATAVHEIGHALGLDHELLCGDVMGYCDPREFLDEAAPCGEHDERVCGNGDRKQNSYRRLGHMVGFRKPAPQQ